jgi:hypothetical protein
MYVFDSAKRRIRKDENKEIKLGEMTIDKDLEHVIKELENYGYVFTLNNEKPDVWFDQQKQYYILRMNDTNHVQNHFFHCPMNIWVFVVFLMKVMQKKH